MTMVTGSNSIFVSQLGQKISARINRDHNLLIQEINNSFHSVLNAAIENARRMEDWIRKEIETIKTEIDYGVSEAKIGTSYSNINAPNNFVIENGNIGRDGATDYVRISKGNVMDKTRSNSIDYDKFPKRSETVINDTRSAQMTNVGLKRKANKTQLENIDRSKYFTLENIDVLDDNIDQNDNKDIVQYDKVEEEEGNKDSIDMIEVVEDDKYLLHKSLEDNDPLFDKEPQHTISNREVSVDNKVQGSSRNMQSTKRELSSNANIVILRLQNELITLATYEKFTNHTETLFVLNAAIHILNQEDYVIISKSFTRKEKRLFVRNVITALFPLNEFESMSRLFIKGSKIGFVPNVVTCHLVKPICKSILLQCIKTVNLESINQSA